MENNNSTFFNQCNYEIKTSTPGKILICGGYLIINPRYSGLVLTTDTKINSTCVFLKSVLIEKENCPEKKYDNLFALIEIVSIDFQLNYKFKLILVKQSNNQLTFQIDQLQGENNNYIYFSIFYSIYFYLSKIWQDYDSSKIIEIFKILKTNVIRLSINSDYRFYTYNKNEFFDNSKKSFSIKTGLGSSSALISSIVTCLYNFLNVTFNQKNELNLNKQNQRLSEINKDDLTFILIASTIANNMAQNKVKF